MANKYAMPFYRVSGGFSEIVGRPVVQVWTVVFVCVSDDKAGVDNFSHLSGFGREILRVISSKDKGLGCKQRDGDY
jgi:hypothetical protein